MPTPLLPLSLKFDPSPWCRPLLCCSASADSTRQARDSSVTHACPPTSRTSTPSARLLEAGAIRVFTDVASGKRSERPGLAELMDHARPGVRRCVIRLDRLGWSLRELLETVDTLKARGIHLVSLEERLDTSSAAGELVFHVFGAIAHFERRLISERTRYGIAAARRRGRTPGRPLSTRRQFRRLRNSPMQACRPLERHNSLGFAGQRRTESPQRCATDIVRP